MAKRPTINTLTNTASPTYLTQLNQNFTNVQTQFDNTLSLDGSTPNAMNADIDLNGNDLINAGVVYTSSLRIGGENVVASAATALAIKKEFETVALLLADTGTYTNYAVDDYLRVVDGGFVYKVAASGASDQHVTTAGGVKLYVLGDVSSIRAFGFSGAGTATDTALGQVALNWLGSTEGRTLVWDLKTASVNGELVLPNASRWSIVLLGGAVKITQTQNNTRIFRWPVSDYRYDVQLFTGGKVVFQWASAQSGANTAAQAIALDPQVNIPDGVFNVHVGTLQNENGYDLLAFTSAGMSYTCPCWAWIIKSIHNQSLATGRVYALQTSTPTGAPATRIDHIYVNGLSASTTPLVMTSGGSFEIGTIEINNMAGRAMLLTSMTNLRIGSLRFEKCSLTAGQDLASIAGTRTVAIGSIHFQTITSSSASDMFGITLFQSEVNITGMIEIDESTISGAGRFYALNPSGSPVGRCSLPATVSVQNSDKIALYAKTSGGSFVFATSFVLGPWCYPTVSGAAFNAAFCGHDGTSGVIEMPCPVSGYIVGVTAHCTAAITAGTVQILPYKNTLAAPSTFSAIAGGFFLSMTSGQVGNYYGIYKWEPPVAGVGTGHFVQRGETLRVVLNSIGVTGGGNIRVSLLIAEAV